MTKAQARQKAKELAAKMTVEERLSQLVYNSPAIERLGIYGIVYMDIESLRNDFKMITETER